MRESFFSWRLVALCLVLAVAAGCATAARKFDREANRLGFSRLIVQGRGFRHVGYFKAGSGGHSGTDLHVYLDGDGSPWVDSRTVAFDPTSRNPLILRLMALDPAPCLYLGRPCYLGLAGDPGCEPYYWTHGRYSQAVVKSMAAALDRWLQDAADPNVVLMGLSGGGTLAMLLAPMIPQIRVVVTLAANLDIDRWADVHGYSHLRGSLNPASLPPLDPSIRRIHYVGNLDTNVPPSLVEAAAEAQPNTEVVVLDGCDHTSCWEALWPSILAHLPR